MSWKLRQPVPEPEIIDIETVIDVASEQPGDKNPSSKIAIMGRTIDQDVHAAFVEFKAKGESARRWFSIVMVIPSIRLYYTRYCHELQVTPLAAQDSTVS